MRVAFDIKLCRPGCALLQGALGGSHGIALVFPTESWLTRLTDDMAVYEITAEQLPLLVEKVHARLAVRASEDVQAAQQASDDG